MKYSIIAAFLLLAACSGNRAGVSATADRSNAQEVLQIRGSAQQSQMLLAALQRRADFGQNVQINVEPVFVQEQAARVSSGSYTGAFDDARAKAQNLAAHMGARLSSAREVTEMLTSGSAYGASGGIRALKGVATSAVRVNAAPNQAITLAVTFGVAGDPSRSISVFGLGATRPQTASMSSSDGLRIDLTAHGPDLASTAARLREADQVVRKIARESGVGESALSVISSNFASY